MNLNQLMNELFQFQTYQSLQKHYLILWFYFFVIFFTATIGHVLDKQNGFTNGLVVGFIVSLALWYQFGRKMV